MDNYKDIFRLANEYYKNQNYDEALELYEQCIRISNNEIVSASSLYNMGTTYIKIRNYDKAIFCFKKVIKNNNYGNLSSAFFNLGYCYTLIEEFYLAYKSFKKSQQLNPGDKDTDKAMYLIKDKITINYKGEI